MTNILIIPGDSPDNTTDIISLAENLKLGFPDITISTIVTLDTYDQYYNCQSIEGFIIKPDSILRKVLLLAPGQYDLVILNKKSLIWNLACKRAGIKNKINLPANLNTKNIDKISNKIQQLSG